MKTDREHKSRAHGIRRRWIVVIATLVSGVPLALGFRGGAFSIHSGGRVVPPGSVPGQSCSSVDCHGFNAGPGGVEIVGAPRRYRPGVLYDLTVRIHDPDQVGAGFELSAEGVDSHVGLLGLSDTVNTRFTSTSFDYVTHTGDRNECSAPTEVGVGDSIRNWAAGGESYEYHLQWEAPVVDAGPVTFFAAGLAINNNCGPSGDRYYQTYEMSHYAVPGDGDGDTDVDMRDTAIYQRCFNGGMPSTGEGCEFVDMNTDGAVAIDDLPGFRDALSASGPTATLPAGYVLADVVRGGLLYDKWWLVNGAPEPIFAPPNENHPLYPALIPGVIGQQSGSATFRCKECHGWDYKGRDGAYGPGSSHYTDIVGIQGTTRSPQQIFDLLKSPDTASGGHDMTAYGMTDRDLWDVVKMTLEGVIETNDIIDGTGTFYTGDAFFGGILYDMVCLACHGATGQDLNFGSAADPEYVGTVAAQNPWEFVHKVRFGNPAAPMPSFELLRFPQLLQRMAAIGKYAATLPQSRMSPSVTNPVSLLPPSRNRLKRSKIRRSYR